MSRDPRSGLVYVPTYNRPYIYFDSRNRPVSHVDAYFSVGGADPVNFDPALYKADFGELPPLRALLGSIPESEVKERGILKAIDPISGKVRWSHASSFREGGVMTTAGNLLFQGSPDGTLRIFASDTGKLLREIRTGTGMMAAPMTYAVKGRQYVAIMAGLGGGIHFAYGPGTAAYRYGNANRIMVFALDGGTVPIPQEVRYPPIPMPPPQHASAASITNGRRLFIAHCSRCHAFGPGLVPDLRRMSPGVHDQFENIVLRGLLAPNGMGRFDDILGPREVRAIHAYLIEEAELAAKGTQSAMAARPAQ